MIDVSINELREKADCMYTVVAVISKRASQIVEEATFRGEALEESAVTLAVEDFMEDRLDFYLPENYKTF